MVRGRFATIPGNGGNRGNVSVCSWSWGTTEDQQGRAVAQPRSLLVKAQMEDISRFFLENLDICLEKQAFWFSDQNLPKSNSKIICTWKWTVWQPGPMISTNVLLDPDFCSVIWSAMKSVIIEPPKMVEVRLYSKHVSDYCMEFSESSCHPFIWLPVSLYPWTGRPIANCKVICNDQIGPLSKTNGDNAVDWPQGSDSVKLRSVQSQDLPRHQSLGSGRRKRKRSLEKLRERETSSAIESLLAAQSTLDLGSWNSNGESLQMVLDLSTSSLYIFWFNSLLSMFSCAFYCFLLAFYPKQAMFLQILVNQWSIDLGWFRSQPHTATINLYRVSRPL